MNKLVLFLFCAIVLCQLKTVISKAVIADRPSFDKIPLEYSVEFQPLLPSTQQNVPSSNDNLKKVHNVIEKLEKNDLDDSINSESKIDPIQFPASGIKIYNQYFEKTYEQNVAINEINEKWRNVAVHQTSYKPYYGGAGGGIVIIILCIIRCIRIINNFHELKHQTQEN